MSDKTEKAIAEATAEEQTAAEQANTAQPEELPVITLGEIEAIDLPGDDATTGAGNEIGRPTFRIADDDCADWAIRKIATERAERDRIVGLAKSQISRLQEQIEKAEHRYTQNTTFLTDRLADFFRGVPHRTTKTTEKYRLLSGTLTMKLGKPTPKADDAKLVEWLKANGHEDLVKVEEKAMWGELKKLLSFTGSMACIESTGEIVDGVTVEQSPDVFTVDL